jgi:hypothetical protein
MKKWAIITLVLAGIISLFVASNDASAFGRRGRCGGFRSCNTTFCAPVVHHAVAVKEVIVPVFAYPVLVPAYQFQYVPTTYAVPTVPVTGYPQAYPVVPQAPGYGYQPQQAYPYGMQGYPPQVQGQYGMQQPNGNQQQQFNLSRKDQIRELAKALIEEMNKMADGQGDNGPPPVSQPNDPPQPQTQNPRQPDPQLTQLVLGSLNRTCAQCHTGVGAKKGFQIFTQPGHLNQNVNWKSVKEELVAEHMPPKDTQFRLAPNERLNILEWLRQIGVN